MKGQRGYADFLFYLKGRIFSFVVRKVKVLDLWIREYMIIFFIGTHERINS